MSSRLALVIVTACASTPAPAPPPAKPRPPVEKKPLAALDDLKPFRSYTGITIGGSPGQARPVEIVEVSATDYTPGTRRIGWVFHQAYILDAKLETVAHSSPEDDWSGFGVIEFPPDVQWLASSSPADVRAAIERHDAHEPSPPLTSFVPADAPMIPAGLVPRITVRMLFYGGGDGRVSFPLHDAVFGSGVTNTIEIERFGKVSIRATLTPTTPRTPAPGHVHADYTGTLAMHVELDGKTVERSYPVSGPIDVEDDTVIAPVGFRIPGASCPSNECELRKLVVGPKLTVDMQGIEPFDSRHDHE
jgi:hypothetical protein